MVSLHLQVRSFVYVCVCVCRNGRLRGELLPHDLQGLRMAVSLSQVVSVFTGNFVWIFMVSECTVHVTLDFVLWPWLPLATHWGHHCRMPWILLQLWTLDELIYCAIFRPVNPVLNVFLHGQLSSFWKAEIWPFWPFVTWVSTMHVWTPCHFLNYSEDWWMYSFENRFQRETEV